MAVSVNLAGGKNVEVNEAVFGQAYNEALIHQIVTAFYGRCTSRFESAKISCRCQRQ